MTIVLASAWNMDAPGVERLERLLPALSELYSGCSIAVPPGSDAALVERVRGFPNMRLCVSRTPEVNRRYHALAQALEFRDAAHIHYCDGDHVVSRLERYPDDWRRVVRAIPDADCLIIERSRAVFETYPRALRETETLINLVMAVAIGRPVDLGSGARGFSREAVEYLVQHASPETPAVATDAEWPVLLHRAGFEIVSVASEGAIYEVEDEAQRERLESADEWAKRVEFARQIISAGIHAAIHREEHSTIYL